MNTTLTLKTQETVVEAVLYFATMELSWLLEPSQLVSYSHMHSVNKELLQTIMHSQTLVVAVGLG